MNLICIKERRPAELEVRGMNEQPCIDINKAQVLALDRETQFAPNGIVSRTLLKTGYSRIVLFGFDAGQELTEHTSTQHALVQVLSGECDFSLAGEKQAQVGRPPLHAARHAARRQGDHPILHAAHSHQTSVSQPS
jgi:hypothetical protein